MEAGKLRHRVEVQSRTLTQDSYGDVLPTWTTQATRWAEVVPVSGREVHLAGRITSETTHTVRLRYLSGLDSKWRILWGTRVLEIESVINTDEINWEMVLACKEVTR